MIAGETVGGVEARVFGTSSLSKSPAEAWFCFTVGDLAGLAVVVGTSSLSKSPAEAWPCFTVGDVACSSGLAVVVGDSSLSMSHAEACFTVRDVACFSGLGVVCGLITVAWCTVDVVAFGVAALLEVVGKALLRVVDSICRPLSTSYKELYNSIRISDLAVVTLMIQNVYVHPPYMHV